MSAPVLLASASPHRKILLERLGLPFVVEQSAVDEEAYPERDPVLRATNLARLKAEDRARCHPDHWIIGCDTLVVASDSLLLEKPDGAAEAASMLRRQSSATSVVHSAVCIVGPDGRTHEGISSSRVTFRTLTEADISWWIGTNLWEGRAGGFQLDGLGQTLIERLEGDWTGVVGLPVFLLTSLFDRAGFDWKAVLHPPS